METLRVRLLSDHESLALAKRNGSSGQWVVERYHQPPVGTGYYYTVSGHLSEDAANRAKARIERKK